MKKTCERKGCFRRQYRDYAFCSVECRERYERENIDPMLRSWGWPEYLIEQRHANGRKHGLQ